MVNYIITKGEGCFASKILVRGFMISPPPCPLLSFLVSMQPIAMIR